MKRVVKKLVQASFLQGKIDKDRVLRIGNSLNRGQLKQYLFELKKKEKEQILYVDIPFNHHELYQKELEKIFPGKRIIFRRDQNLLLGIRIVDNDNIYEISMNKVLTDLVDYIKEYD